MSTNERSAVPERSRGVNIALWGAQILLAGYFAFVAANKLLGASAEVVLFDEIGLGQWFRYVTGVVELAGAVGLLLPRLAGIAALALAGVMVGATATNLFVLEDGAILAAQTTALLVLFLLLAWGRWPWTRSLVDRIRGL
ncbi:DoxX family protein [Lipingzhangella rawalii]|uniref:DoxX family protein n=1 Tax=Lipingzhangella rawalii TaxID=2055835 RepID=UPI003899163B